MEPKHAVHALRHIMKYCLRLAEATQIEQGLTFGRKGWVIEPMAAIRRG